MGPQARNWLAKFFSRLLVEHRIPRVWRQAKVIALPKPGKDITLAASYRPISLLSVCFKLLERIILRRIAPTVDAVLSPSQAGFRQWRSTSDQVCALTTFVENGFQQGLKTGAVFVDVTAALISKLAGTSWGANAQTLRSSAVALCYSVAEYCVPAWGRSSHVKLVDRQLNETMQSFLEPYTPNPTPMASCSVSHRSTCRQTY